MNPTHRPMAGNCRITGVPKTGLDKCEACARPESEKVWPRALKVERGRVVEAHTYDPVRNAAGNQKDTTAFGQHVVPQDGTYLHLDMVEQILEQTVRRMDDQRQQDPVHFYPRKCLAQDLLDHFKEMRL